MSPLRKNEQSQRAGEIQPHNRQHQTTTDRDSERVRGDGEQRGENKCGSCLRSWQKANGSGLLGNGGATSGNEPTWLPHEALVLALSQTPVRGQLSVDL